MSAQFFWCDEKPGVIHLGPGMKAFSACDVVIITPTSIIKNTFDGLLAALIEKRAAATLGPSTPLYPEAFVDSKNNLIQWGECR